jgi:hypothetical protein
MKRVFAVVAAVPLLAAPARTEDKPPKASQACVLVELFTSQGCSSCPPAEDYLAKIVAGGKEFENVVAVAWHVDYWDQLGWKDPFGSKGASDLQGRYARTFGLRGNYTPMFVVNGGSHTSRPSEVAKSIEAERKSPQAATIALKGSFAAGKASLQAEVTLNPHEKGAFEIFVVVLEDDLKTDITAGELKDKSVVEFAVARWTATNPHEGKPHAWDIPVAEDWKKDKLSFVVGLRSNFSMRTMGAARIAFAGLENAEGK